MTFRYLQNLGSSTRWDATEYGRYLERVRLQGQIPEQLEDMLTIDRLGLDKSRSFWGSELSALTFTGATLVLGFISENETRRFSFSYGHVARVVSEFQLLEAAPTLITQELQFLKRGFFRHLLSDYKGRKFGVIARTLAFEEVSLN